MKLTAVFNFSTIGEYATFKPDFSVTDVTELLSVPMAQHIGTALSKSSPYHSHPIADVKSDNDNETLIFTIETDYFNWSKNYDPKIDFETLFDCFGGEVHLEEFAVDSTAADDVADMLIDFGYHYLEQFVAKCFEEADIMIDFTHIGTEINRADWFTKPDGLIYTFDVDITA